MVRETKTGQSFPAHHQAQAVTTPVITAEIKTKTPLEINASVVPIVLPPIAAGAEAFRSL